MMYQVTYERSSRYGGGRVLCRKRFRTKKEAENYVKRNYTKKDHPRIIKNKNIW